MSGKCGDFVGASDFGGCPKLLRNPASVAVVCRAFKVDEVVLRIELVMPS